MANHITVRLAWHSEGWNGHVCKEPKKNTYCIGRHSYPGDLISSTRDLNWEMKPAVCGKHCSKVDGVPACAYSINAFGAESCKAFSEPPEWFHDGSKGAYIDLPPATVCTWPYEGMFRDDVLNTSNNGQKYDNNARFKNAQDYFGRLEEDKTLLFYYANYSNPFSEEDYPKYVLVGISRLKSVGNFQYYDNVSERIKERYANGVVWQMPLTSHYPEQGFRIPYEKYMDRPDIIEKILFVPENARNFKYATRPVSNDDALSMVERLLNIVNILLEEGDDTQNWEERRTWLYGLLSELWKNRGPYPGLPEVLRYLDLSDAISYYYSETDQGNGKEAYDVISDFITGKAGSIPEISISANKVKGFQRNWKLRDNDEKELLLNTLPRFDLAKEQIQNIISEKRDNYSITAKFNDIIENPYILSEQYIGANLDDYISFNKIDNGMLPSPELGLEYLGSKNSAERFRALCVSELKRDNTHSFVLASRILTNVNRRIANISEWKRHEFNERYFEVDEEVIKQAITVKNHEDKLYLYLNEVFEDERLIQNTIRQLVQRGDIKLKIPATDKHFFELLKAPNSDLNNKAASEYEAALKRQAEVCVKIFNKPLCVISGAAGTGKTTIIKSIIKTVERVHGTGTSILLMAPTGKATERMKEKTKKSSSTIHSFLAQKGWQNDNMTFKRIGGTVESDISTIIIDECSMVDLNLFASLFRAVKWNNVQRLILIGDPNQLPPIGRGKVFADIIEWLRESYPENLGKLDINVRQLENRVIGKGNGILDLAEIFIQEKQSEDAYDKTKHEMMLKKVQDSGVIDKDLSVYYWNNATGMEKLIRDTIIQDLQEDTGEVVEEKKEYLLWGAGCKKKNGKKDPTYLQVLSPFKGEFYGTDILNTIFQRLFNGYQASRNVLDGIALFDKVIQFRNRPKSDQIFAYDMAQRQGRYCEVYNGEIGFVWPHKFDKDEWKSPRFRLKKFQVVFNGKEELLVGYGSKLGQDNKGWWIPEQKPEENLELAYAISVHKAQGSEFERVYFVLPKRSSNLLSMELMYTAITRAQRHLTIFIQEDISTLMSLTRIEKSNLRRINSSLFDFKPIPEAFVYPASGWFEEGKVVSTLSQYFVRSKSEMNIANILTLKDIDFKYEEPLFADDGSMYLPDFTVKWQGETYFWEHVGRLDLPNYREHWEEKKKWYDKHFPGQLIVTYEGEDQSKQIERILMDVFGLSNT